MKNFNLNKNPSKTSKKYALAVISALSLGMGFTILNSPIIVNAATTSTSTTNLPGDDGIYTGTATTTKINGNDITFAAKIADTSYFNYKYNTSSKTVTYVSDDSNDKGPGYLVSVNSYQINEIFNAPVSLSIGNSAATIYSLDGSTHGSLAANSSATADQSYTSDDGTTFYRIGDDKYVKSTDATLASTPKTTKQATINYQDEDMSTAYRKIPIAFDGKTIGIFTKRYDYSDEQALLKGDSISVAIPNLTIDGITYSAGNQEVHLVDGKLALTSGAATIESYISSAPVNITYVKADTGEVITTYQGQGSTDQKGNFNIYVPNLSDLKKSVTGYADNGVDNKQISISAAKVGLDTLNQTVKVPALPASKPITLTKNYYLNDILFSTKTYTLPIGSTVSDSEKFDDPTKPDGEFSPDKSVTTLSLNSIEQSVHPTSDTTISYYSSMFFLEGIPISSDYDGMNIEIDSYITGNPQESLVTITKDLTVKTNLGDKAVTVSGKPGTTFKVDAPKVTGYTADPAQINVTISKDGKEVTTDDSVNYTKVKSSSSSNHNSSTSTTTNTNGQITKLAQTVATFADRPDVTIDMDDLTQITDVKLGSNSAWFSDEKKTVDGVTYYRVATDKWAKASDVYVYVAENSIVTTNNNLKYIPLVNAHGDKITNRALAPNTSWKTDRTTVINGKTYYRVATNEFVAQDLVSKN